MADASEEVQETTDNLTASDEAVAPASHEQTTTETNGKQSEENSDVISPLEEKVIRQIEVLILTQDFHGLDSWSFPCMVQRAS